ncbi:MAG: hypothetical protein KUG77_14900, partial [Nannocystaceae bacterium]|nr:hypothetical protein [Nannocystaceae bacterium]
MARQWLTPSFPVVASLMLSACFNPEDPPASGDTDTVASSSTMTAGRTSGETSSGETSSGETTGDGTGCGDACVLGSASQCDGDVLQTCVEGGEGCAVLQPIACAQGCELGACVEAPCGDGSLEEPEACDDGNTAAGDGCSEGCEVEDGWTCAGTGNGECTAPDLAIRILSAAFSNRGLQVTYHVQNVGGAPSGAYRVDLWDTRAGGLENPPDLGQVGALTLSDKPSLEPGDTDLFTDTIPVPANGTHFAFAVVDTMDELVELDENDNVALGSAWTNAGSVVHASFASTQTPISIPSDGTPGMAEVSVGSFAGATPELFVSINVSHPNVAELTARVFGEDGGTVMLLSDLVEGENLRSTSIREGGTEFSSGTPPQSRAGSGRL